MKDFLAKFGADHHAGIGLGGIIGMVTLAQANAFIGCLIGLATLAYMSFKAAREYVKFREEESRKPFVDDENQTKLDL